MNKKDDKSKSGLTNEDSSVMWERYVRSELNAMLDIFLPNSKSGTVGVKYKPVIIKRHPGYDELDETKARGVEVRIVFDFEEIVDKPVGK